MGIARGSEVQEIFIPLELCKSVYKTIDKELIFLQRERERERERERYRDRPTDRGDRKIDRQTDIA